MQFPGPVVQVSYLSWLVSHKYQIQGSITTSVLECLSYYSGKNSGFSLCLGQPLWKKGWLKLYHCKEVLPFSIVQITQVWKAAYLSSWHCRSSCYHQPASSFPDPQQYVLATILETSSSLFNPKGNSGAMKWIVHLSVPFPHPATRTAAQVTHLFKSMQTPG